MSPTSGKIGMRAALRMPLLVFALVGVLLTVVSGVVYIRAGSLNPTNPTSTVFGELFKAALTLSLVTIGGAALKVALDDLLEEQRVRRAEAQQHADRRDAIIREYIEVFSSFYSVRKLYHSALEANKSPYVYKRTADDYGPLIKDLLKRSVELEGRFGALKVLAITVFELPLGDDLGTKRIRELQKALLTDENPHQKARLRLDLLGQLYDDWRHALEEDRKILQDNERRHDLGENPEMELWRTYKDLLNFFLQDRYLRIYRTLHSD